jgi:alpha-L-rhamnosidase
MAALGYNVTTSRRNSKAHYNPRLLPSLMANSREVCAVTRLRCEYQESPLGLDVLCPRFSWEIDDFRPGAKQTAWQVQVAISGERLNEGTTLWDSGMVEGGQSVLVAYGGPALQPLTPYCWRARIWDADLEPSAWSLPQHWETGFMGAPRWPASWIGLNLEKDDDSPNPGRYLRCDFELDFIPTKGRLYITAMGLFEPWINGRRVGQDWLTPGWTDYGRRVEYLTYDVTNCLRLGTNALGAIIADGWYCGYLGLRGTRNHYGAEPALLSVLRVSGADGELVEVGSGPAWRGSTGPLHAADLYMGETYDARQENAEWCMPGAWEGSWRPSAPVSVAPVELEGKIAAPVRAVEEIAARKRSQTAHGSFVYDFGQNLVGVVRLNLEAPRGTRVTLRHAEMLSADGALYVENLRSARATDVYFCRGGGVETYAPRFTFHGFRYVEIDGLETPPALPDVSAIVLHTGMESGGRFSCSDDLVNQLQSNIQWGQRGNFLDIPTDCPQRDERLGWTGDAQVFAPTAAYNYNVAPFFRKWLRDLRDAQYEDGAFPDVAPDLLRISNAMLNRTPNRGGNAAWADAGVICPWVMYLHYGDWRILDENYDAMCLWMAFQERTSHGGARPATSYGDWLSPDAVRPNWSPTPSDLIGTAYFAHTARLMARIAVLLNRPADARQFRSMRKRAVEAFRREYMTPSGRMAGDTQTAYLLALAFDLAPRALRPEVADWLVQALARRDGHLSTGFVGTPLLAPVLTRIGRTDLAYKLLLTQTYPSWLFPVVNGATTMWERWNSWTPEEGFGDMNMNSFNHYAYGAIGEWLYGTVAGIAPDWKEPGFKRILFRPEPGGGLTHAEASLRTPYGQVESAWRFKDNVWEWTVLVPPNTTGVAVLPKQLGGDFLLDSNPFELAPGAAGIELSAGRFCFECPAGQRIGEPRAGEPFVCRA